MNIGGVMAFIIIAVILALSLKAKNPEISSLISIAICIVIVSLCIGRLEAIINSLKSITNHINIEKTYLIVLLKLIGIAYICEFASGISKDAGYSAVASQIELVGKLTMLMVSMPILLQVIETIVELM